VGPRTLALALFAATLLASVATYLHHASDVLNVILRRASMARSFAVTLNALGLCAIAMVLLVAFAAQLVLHELPCPSACSSASSSRCFR